MTAKLCFYTQDKISHRLCFILANLKSGCLKKIWNCGLRCLAKKEERTIKAEQIVLTNKRQILEISRFIRFLQVKLLSMIEVYQQKGRRVSFFFFYCKCIKINVNVLLLLMSQFSISSIISSLSATIIDFILFTQSLSLDMYFISHYHQTRYIISPFIFYKLSKTNVKKSFLPDLILLKYILKDNFQYH